MNGRVRLPQPDTDPAERRHTVELPRIQQRLISAGFLIAALSAVACGGAPDRPEVRGTGGRTEYIVSDGASEGAEPCEHGSVVECKVWVTETDCFTGLAVCDHGELSGCTDADGAEQKLAEISETVE